MATGSLGVIIAAYNAQDVIGDALASLEAQVRLPDQVVVVDDASSDRTAEIAREWKDRLPLRVITLDENAGSGAARAKGIEALRTDLIALLDADDKLIPEHLEVMTRTHAQHGGLIAPGYFRWRPGIATVEHPSRLPAPDRQLEAFLFRNFIISATLFDLNLYEEAGGFRDYRRSQDWDLWLRMLARGARVTLAQPATVFYRLRAARWPLEQILTVHIEILKRFISEQSDPRMKEIASRSIRNHQARLALTRSFAAAAAGNTKEARRFAWESMKGDARLRLRSATMLLAPRLGLSIKRSRGVGTLQGDLFDREG